MMTSPTNQSFQAAPQQPQYQPPQQQINYNDPANYLVGPHHPHQDQQQHRQPQMDVSYIRDAEYDDGRDIDDRSQFFNQPPVNFPSQNTKNNLNYFELQKLMYPVSAPRKRDVTPTRAYRSSSGAGTPANVSSMEGSFKAGEVPIYDSYLRHDNASNRKQFGGGGTSEFASSNPMTPTTGIVTDSRISDNPDKNFKSGGSVPTFVPKNYVAPPNFGSARKMRQNSDSGLAPTYSNSMRRIKRSSSLTNQPGGGAGADAPPMAQPRRNLARQSKIERNLAKSYGLANGGRGGRGGSVGGGGSISGSSVDDEYGRPDSVLSSRSVSMSPAPSLQRQRQQQQSPQQQQQQQQQHQVKFNPESRVIYYDDYDTMTEDEDDYELVFNDPMPSQQTGTYSYSFKHNEEEEEAEERMKKLALMNGRNVVGDDGGENGGGRGFKTISPPTYGEDGIREVPMDREIPIQRPSGENNRVRNNNNHGEGDEEEEDDVASEASPNASPTRQLGKR